jgi:hypothetical protein
MALGIASELRRCLQQKQSSKNDETVENGRIRRMAVLWCSFGGTTSMKKSMRQTTLFSIVSSNWGDSFGSEHLPSDI